MNRNFTHHILIAWLLAVMAACGGEGCDPPFDPEEGTDGSEAAPEVAIRNLTWKESVTRSETARLRADILNGVAAEFRWTLDGEEVSTDSVYEFRSQETGAHRVRLTATNEAGSGADSLDIEVTDGFSLSSVRNWTGEGENEAVLAIQWVAPEAAASPEPADGEVLFLAWGYRWEATEEKVGMDMIRAIAAADPRLFVLVSESGLGTTVLGFGYDGNGDGKILVHNPEDESSAELRETDFTNGIYDNTSLAIAPDGLEAVSEGDWWMSGWQEAYLSYWVHEGEAVTQPEDFEYSNFGVSARALTHRSWDTWTFSSINSEAVNIEPIVRLLRAAD